MNLRALLTLGRTRHFGRAAEQLHISQPGLSQLVKKLEADLGVQLLKRDKRRVEFTYPGRLFMEQLEPALEKLDRALDVAARAARGELGRFTLGYIDSTLYTVFPGVIQALRKSYPAIDLRLEERVPAEQAHALFAGELDAGLMYTPPGDAALDHEVILQEGMMVALPREHLLAQGVHLNLTEVGGEHFIMNARDQDPRLYDQVMRQYETLGFTPKVVQTAKTKQAIVGLVASGVGLALLPASMQNLQRPGVVYRPLDEPSLSVKTSLVWRRGDTSPVLETLRQALRDGLRAADSVSSTVRA